MIPKEEDKNIEKILDRIVDKAHKMYDSKKYLTHECFLFIREQSKQQTMQKIKELVEDRDFWIERNNKQTEQIKSLKEKNERLKQERQKTIEEIKNDIIKDNKIDKFTKTCLLGYLDLKKKVKL